MRNFLVLVLTFVFISGISFADEPVKNVVPQPITVNGDIVEYSTENKEVTAKGHVEVIYKGTKLTCDKLTVNTETKDGVAEGNVRLEDAKGIIEGQKVTYNFQTKAGTIINSEFRANPYFGKAKEVDKINDTEFVALNGNMSTCNYDRPHYHFNSKKIDFFPGDKVKIKDNFVYIGRIPVFWLPRYDHSLKDPLMHVQVMPGMKKEWGPYLLTAWRYTLTESVKGRIYLDYRKKLGFASGVGANYTSKLFGRGDYKFYYTREKPEDLPAGALEEFQRYFIRWRHKWEIDSQTNLTSEYYKLSDEKRKKFDSESDFLKDYFYREYEKNTQPLSYILLQHSFAYSSINFLMQKRTNHWYDQLEKLPEVRYSLPSLQIGDTRLYFENNTSLANLDKKATTAPVTPDEENVTRLDTTNKLSLPLKVAFVELVPFVAGRQTLYDKGTDGASGPLRTIFYSGIDASTKFYRVFNVQTNFLGMEIDGVRHIITPTIRYSYNHEPTIKTSKLKQIDATDAIDTNNSAVLELTNKLQTKRLGKTVDFANLKVSSIYTFYNVDPQTQVRSHGHFQDILFDLELIPNSRMRFDADATYSNSGDYFSNANYDLNFNLGKERSFGLGQRYQRTGSNEITYNLNWPLNPKWRFSFYQRYNLGGDPALSKGFREQEYTISRDLHCWVVDISLNIKKNEGTTIWLIFRLKAFPEMEFGFNQSYHSPKSGSQ